MQCTKHLSYLESDDLHAKHCCIKVHRVRHTFHCKNQMIQMAQLNWAGSFELDISTCLDGDSLQEKG